MYALRTPETTASLPGTALVVQTRALTKRYHGTAVVDRLDLAVPGGGVYGFLGPNGAGKSTTMKLLLGLTRPSAGDLRILGHPFPAARRRVLPRVGALIEGPSFYPQLTGRQNLRLFADQLGVPHGQAEQLLATVGLTRHGDRKARQYSMGMKQRLGIAMALTGDPRLLLLDEPTNGLDPAGVAEIRSLVVALAHEQGRTVIVSSHVLSDIEQMADTVGILSTGRMLYQGPLDGLRDAGHLLLRTGDPAQTVSLLRTHHVPAELTGDGHVLCPMLPDDRTALVVRELVSAGIEVHAVHPRRRTLEEAFLDLTAGSSAQGVS